MVARFIAVGTACILALSVAGAVFAKSGGQVEIIVTIVNGQETGFEVVQGASLLCAGGTSENFFEKFGGAGPSAAGTFHGYKTLTCSDDSGTFSITYDAATVWGAPQDQGGWHLFGGTGELGGCTGGGNLVGLYPDWNTIIDHYTGRVSCP
jgi:hypothetical protein